MFDDDIMSIVQKKLNAKRHLSLAQLQEVSDSLSTYAEAKSYDAKYESPFCIESRIDKTSKTEEVGGKEDDITVIVAQVSAEDEDLNQLVSFVEE